MPSMIFSEEEARFLRLVLKLAERPHDANRASWMPFASDTTKAAGEFRILVIGGQGVGKTSLLTKFRTGTFPAPSALPSSESIHGCCHTIKIESSLYTVDALELPPDHLTSPEHLRQALAITEAAVLVYDITDHSSLTYLKSLSSTIYEALHHRLSSSSTTTTTTTTTPKKKRTGFPFTTSSPTRAQLAARPSRPYHFLLLGTKSDAPATAREVRWLEGHTAAGEFFGPHGVAGGASASFLEASARTGDNVAAVFSLLGREVLRSRRERGKAGVGGLGRRYATEGGAWACSGFDFEDDDGDGDACADHKGGCECADGGWPLRRSVRRRWYAFKATLTRGFGREGGK
ncbi:unnamed protein product [Discula destructiva]